MDREPLEVEALSQALRLANAEVKELRDQCDDLRSMVSPLQRTGYGDSVKNSPKVPPPTGFHYTSSRKQSGLPPEIADLSEDEAKEALVVRAIYPTLSNRQLNEYSRSLCCPHCLYQRPVCPTHHPKTILY